MARYGGKFGSNAEYRVFADGFAYNQFPGIAGRNGNDDWTIVQRGVRVDANASAQNSITVEGDAYSGNAGEIASSVVSIFPPVNGALPLNDRFSGWNLLSRWNHVVSPHSETSLQERREAARTIRPSCAPMCDLSGKWSWNMSAYFVGR